MKNFTCPHCLGEHQLYECMCDNANLIDIPSCFFESSDNVYIPIVGSKMTGKSVYAGVLAKALRSPNIRFAHDMSYEYFLDSFYEPLYKYNSVCDADAPGEPKPLMFEINSISHEDGCNKSISKYGMAIYDIQGQVFCEEEWLKFFPSYRRLIERANGVIFMIDCGLSLFYNCYL